MELDAKEEELLQEIDLKKIYNECSFLDRQYKSFDEKVNEFENKLSNKVVKLQYRNYLLHIIFLL